MKKRIFSGIRATGKLHLGNYLGAIKGMLALQNDPRYEMIFSVVDIHAMTTPFDKKTLARNTKEIIIDYLAAGMNPKKSILLIQSQVADLHAELMVYFSTVVNVARMLHLPTYKEKIAQHPKNVTMALLNYPLLMAADILMYKSELVPVGIDQEPHLEVTREIARKMNQLYGTDFPQPKRFITQGEYIPSLKGEGKMSKTITGSYISLTDNQDTIRKKIRFIPTATVAGGKMTSGIKTLFTLADLFIPNETISFKRDYENGTLKFVEIKDALATAIYKILAPLQRRKREIAKDNQYINQVVKEGTEKARTIAQKTLQEVKDRIGLYNFRTSNDKYQ